jgi:hypothetical protein
LKELQKRIAPGEEDVETESGIFHTPNWRPPQPLNHLTKTKERPPA